MIGFDRPLKPRWIYETLLLVEPGQKISELKKPFESIAIELTGKEGKRKVRTVLFRSFIRDDNKARVKRELMLKKLTEEYDLEFMTPIYLFYLIGKTPVVYKISEHIFRLYGFGEEINLSFLKNKLVDIYGERDVVKRSVGSFIKTLIFFGVVKECNSKKILKNKLQVNEEQFRIMIQLLSYEIICSPQISLTHLPKIFMFFELPDLQIVAQKYIGRYWDYQHRVKDELLIVF